MRRQEQPPVQGLWSPRSAMEVLNQSGQPRKSGKRRPMWPAPLTSGGLALEEVTCRGWGPHLQYPFLIKLASLSGKYLSYRGSLYVAFTLFRVLTTSWLVLSGSLLVCHKSTHHRTNMANGTLEFFFTPYVLMLIPRRCHDEFFVSFNFLDGK